MPFGTGPSVNHSSSLLALPMTHCYVTKLLNEALHGIARNCCAPRELSAMGIKN
jgi:hypothetical protein